MAKACYRLATMDYDQPSTMHIVLKIILDVICLILAFLPFGILELIGSPFRRGFYCNDESLYYPYHEDTISIATVTLVGLLVPIGVIMLVEGLHYVFRDKSRNELNSLRCSLTCSLPGYVVAWYAIIGVFLFGCVVSQSITDIGKFSIGRLRPHFMTVCKPNMTLAGCTLPSDSNIYVYVTNTVCAPNSNYSQHAQDDVRLSFPSGHSSMAAYCAAFLCFYLQARVTWKGSILLRHLLQVICVYAAVYVCMSRVSDYKHHWSDVTGGAIIGVFIACLAALHVSRVMWKNGCQSDTPSLSTDGTDLPIVTTNSAGRFNEGNGSRHPYTSSSIQAV